MTAVGAGPQEREHVSVVCWGAAFAGHVGLVDHRKSFGFSSEQGKGDSEALVPRSDNSQSTS